ncbi:MAG TPA: cytochrome c oxidase assembly protein, partial [Euzebyales bacterium]|nr:cytochrome c oxidase assembly protein [Euzebyales bacterium]
LASVGRPPVPQDVWGAWNLDPLLITGVVLAAWAYRRGRIGGPRRAADVWRSRCFAGALVALAVALISPLDAMASALASAHMVQHVLLILVAAPLLALSAPSSALLRGTPPAVRRASTRWRRRFGLTHANLEPLRHPVTVWLLHAATLWLWHARVLYDAALTNPAVHIAEHATFVVTGLLFWRVVIGSRTTGRVSPGLAVLLIFTMALQSVFLSVLLVFARTPWYAGYATTTRAWGLDQLADQQLAGVIMWVPAGMIYVAAGLTVMITWLRAVERQAAEL